MVKTSSPGYYRKMLGSFEISVLSDGTGEMPVDELLTKTTPSRVHRALADAYLTSPVETSDNSYLINSGSKLILIDAGAGDRERRTKARHLGRSGACRSGAV
jgi:hypothetical protein